MNDVPALGATSDTILGYEEAADKHSHSAWVLEIQRAVRDKGICDTGTDGKPLPASHSADERP